ncbi:hypothetical protein Lal_00039567 [Lupinus albus]|nr:hypothetical protein Lal_00039567 [Lupinus albus]
MVKDPKVGGDKEKSNESINWVITAIMESKDLDSMSITTLFGKFQEHKMELGPLTLHDHTNKNMKIISFIAKISHSRSQKEGIDDETMSLIVHKFRKFLGRKGRFREFHKEDVKHSIKKGKYPKDKATCYQCEKVGHMRYTYPTYLKNVEQDNTQDSREIKAKKAYIIRDAPEKDTTSTSTSKIKR